MSCYYLAMVKCNIEMLSYISFPENRKLRSKIYIWVYKINYDLVSFGSEIELKHISVFLL